MLFGHCSTFAIYIFYVLLLKLKCLLRQADMYFQFWWLSLSCTDTHTHMGWVWAELGEASKHTAPLWITPRRDNFLFFPVCMWCYVWRRFPEYFRHRKKNICCSSPPCVYYSNEEKNCLSHKILKTALHIPQKLKWQKYIDRMSQRLRQFE